MAFKHASQSSNGVGRLTAALARSTALVAPALIIGAVALPCATMIAPQSAFAQDYTSANLTGRVVSDAGSPISGATVVVRSAQGTVRTSTTQADGSFKIGALAFGSYTVTVTAANYGGIKDTISVGPNGSSYNFTLASGDVQAVIVTAKRTQKVADFSKTDTGLVVDVAELSNTVPVGRNITSVVNLAPSVSIPDASINASARRNQSLSSVSGTSAGESVYYLNGLNVTDQRTFLGFASIPFDAIQTVEVKTGGYSAEFGRATGGVINTTTKSGTNEFHAGASTFYSPESLRSHAPNGFSPSTSGNQGFRIYNDTQRSSSIEGDVYLSGPIVKDHVFFFGIVDQVNSQSTGAASVPIQSATNLSPTSPGSVAKTSYRTPFWLTKLDFVATDRQRLEATIFSDATKTVTKAFAYDRNTGIGAPASLESDKSGGVNQIYKYTGVFTDWFTLSAQYGQVRSEYSTSSPQAGISRSRDYITTPGVLTYLTPVRSAISIDSPAQDIRESTRVDADFNFNAVGHHHVRLGYDQENLRSTDNSHLGGGAAWDFRIAPASGKLAGSTATYATPGSLYARQLVYNSGGNFKATQNAFYVQDSWEITPRLTLQLGVRDDLYNYLTASGKSFIKLKDQFAQRVGMSYDINGDGRDKIYLSSGRYFLPIAENTAIREAGANPYYYRYYSIPSLQVSATGQPTNLGAVITPDVIFGSDIAPDARTIASANIKPQFTDEFIVGYEHRFRELSLFGINFDNTKFGISYTNRRLGDTIEDTDLGPAVDAYCAVNNIASCSGANSGLYDGSYNLLNPGKPARVFLDLVNGPGSGSGQYYDLSVKGLGLPSAQNRYQAVQFTFDRPFDGTWGLQGSYVWSRSVGNYEGGVSSDIGQTDTSITQDFDNPYNEIGQYGYLPNNHTHTIKLFGTYSPFSDLTVGVNFTAQSGRKFGCLGYDPADPGSLSPTPSQRFCPVGPGGSVVMTSRGSQYQASWTTNTDLQVSYRLGFSVLPVKPIVSLDVFNLFDEHEITRIVEQGVNSGDVNTLSPVYQLPRSYQSPRSVRFGIKAAF